MQKYWLWHHFGSFYEVFILTLIAKMLLNG